VGQFEYGVGLSPVKPEDMPRIVREYKEKQERDKMIKHEFGMLVLDAAMSKDDQEAVNSFVHEQILKERKRIIAEFDNASKGYDSIQMAKFKVKQIVNNSDKLEY
jgi:hypothetical protein